MDTRLEKLKRGLESAIEGMSSEQMSWHPPGKWCAAEVLEHLYLTYTGTIKGFERLLQSGQPTATPASIRQRWRTLAVVGFGYFPPGRKSPPVAAPRGLPLEKVRSELSAKIGAMDTIMEQCEVRFGRGIPLLDHPMLGPLNATQWKKFHFVHGMHHRKQLLHLRRAAENK
ncbi:MAG: DinB family protein [Candidatus Sulfotelmatobacter sp.]